MVPFAFITGTLAALLWYAASPRQKWFEQPLPAFAARGSAILSAMVATKACLQLLTPVTA